MSDYHDLKAWKEALKLRVLIQEIVRQLPRSEDSALKAQLNKSSLSIVSNIVEGTKKSIKSFINYLTIAHASTAELETQLHVVATLDLVSSERVLAALDKTDHVSRLIFLLRRGISKCA